jgi:hypothetical protein
MDQDLFTRRRGMYILESSNPQTCINPARLATRVCLPESIRECQGGGGGSRKVSSRFSQPHIPSKNPRPVSRIQAYMAYLLSSDVLRTTP